MLYAAVSAVASTIVSTAVNSDHSDHSYHQSIYCINISSTIRYKIISSTLENRVISYHQRFFPQHYIRKSYSIINITFKYHINVTKSYHIINIMLQHHVLSSTLRSNILSTLENHIISTLENHISTLVHNVLRTFIRTHQYKSTSIQAIIILVFDTVIPQVPLIIQVSQYQGTGKLVDDELQQYSADLVCWELGAQWSAELSLLSSQRRPQFPRTRESLVCWWETSWLITEKWYIYLR